MPEIRWKDSYPGTPVSTASHCPLHTSAVGVGEPILSILVSLQLLMCFLQVTFKVHFTLVKQMVFLNSFMIIHIFSYFNNFLDSLPSPYLLTRSGEIWLDTESSNGQTSPKYTGTAVFLVLLKQYLFIYLFTCLDIHIWLIILLQCCSGSSF